MSNSVFISVVSVIQINHSPDSIRHFIDLTGTYLSERFDHFEIILVINGPKTDFDSIEIDKRIRRSCYLLELSQTVLWDSAVMAGLQRANGDFIANLDVSFEEQVHLIRQMYEVVQSSVDIVYARGGDNWANLSTKRRIFYWLLNLTRQTKFDEYARPEFMLSRRALNWITQNRASGRFINESLFGTGFDLVPLEVNAAAQDSRRGRDESIGLAWSAILRSAGFPAIFGSCALFLITLIAMVAIFDALLVRFFGLNLFLQPVEYVPGWAFLVVLVSSGFVILTAMIYALLRSVYIVIDELQTRPPYIVKKFGRL
jgi:glucosyltransferase